MLLKNCRFLVTQNENRDVLENVDVRIEDEKIVEIGENLHGEELIDCSNKIVMPGLINAHTHLGMTLLRGISDDEELKPWLKKIVDAEKQLTDEQFKQGALLGIKEALRTGTTTIFDLYHPIEPAIAAAKELGVRLVAARGFFSEHEVPKLEVPESTPLVTGALAPHSIYGTTEQLLNDLRKLATKTQAILTVHVAETRTERADIKRKLKMLPVEYLHSLNFLGPDVVLSHCIWLTKHELDLIAEAGTHVAHCPQANMKLAGGGTMPVREMLERGINIALGTDSVVSNNSLDMFRAMYTAALLHKHHYWIGEATTAQQVLDMATVNGAKAVGINAGSIEKGKLADIITLDLANENLQPCMRERVVSYLVYSASGFNVTDVLINGKVVDTV